MTRRSGCGSTDPTGKLVEANQSGAAAIAAFFAVNSYNKSGDLFSWYYGNTGEDYQLDTATIDQWMLDNTIPAQSPLQALSNNRDQAVAQAICQRPV